MGIAEVAIVRSGLFLVPEAIRDRHRREQLGVEHTGEVLPHIFDPFQQGETSTLRRSGGLGPGLAISRGIVESHGGRLVAESRGVGQGATFRIELGVIPRAEAGNGEVTGDRASEEVRPVRVLLVEDEPQTSRLLARLVRGLDHEVTTAETLRAACDAARSQSAVRGATRRHSR